MKKLILRIFDIKDPEEMKLKDIEDLLRRKFPSYHIHQNPTRQTKDGRKGATVTAGEFVA